MRTISWRHLAPRAWQRRQALWPGAPWQVLVVAVVCRLSVLGALGHTHVAWGATGRAPGGAVAVDVGSPARALAPAVAVVPFQLLAWWLAVEQGLDPGVLAIASKVTTRE